MTLGSITTKRYGWAPVIKTTKSATVNVASIADGASDVSNTVTVTGAALGDFVLASCAVDLAGLQFKAYVSAADTVTLVFFNKTGGAVDLASTTFRFLIIDAGSGQ